VYFSTAKVESDDTHHARARSRLGEVQGYAISCSLASRRHVGCVAGWSAVPRARVTWAWVAHVRKDISW
jgi:hypothetical protein